MSDIANRELDWYLRDHLFRQMGAGRKSFITESLPTEMATLYLRYKNADLKQLSLLVQSAVNGLISKKVLEQVGNELRISTKLVRLQCAKCFYINYLGDAEQRSCLRCQH